LTHFWHFSAFSSSGKLFHLPDILTKRGDCDDGAILMANLMLTCGVPYWKIRLTCGDTPIGGHAYLTYYCEETNRWVAMDWCYHPKTSQVSKRKDYKESPIYTKVWFSWNLKYAYSKGITSGVPATIK
jgi:predicted transglutaminase-like cysteine proteinase